MTGWQQVHRRTDLLNLVLDEITGTGSAQVPAVHIAAIEAEFGGFDEFLLAAHQRWSTAYAARLDGLLEEAPDDMATGLARICAELRALRPGLRTLLDYYSDNPALAAAEDRQWRQLVAATGVTTMPAMPVMREDGRRTHCPLGQWLIGMADRRIRRVLHA
ncbi:hypothetical protein [Fodinicola feengrottensis]|uniref:Uncharacterized protein n=2 Tax=Fodinicola feengrottensis TaxID=435914 RepID=A0ABN2GVE3_9ACTN|nr:hypothetical protein [Fodinicola feengrottensis]